MLEKLKEYFEGLKINTGSEVAVQKHLLNIRHIITKDGNRVLDRDSKMLIQKHMEELSTSGSIIYATLPFAIDTEGSIFSSASAARRFKKADAKLICPCCFKELTTAGGRVGNVDKKVSHFRHKRNEDFDFPCMFSSKTARQEFFDKHKFTSTAEYNQYLKNRLELPEPSKVVANNVNPILVKVRNPDSTPVDDKPVVHELSYAERSLTIRLGAATFRDLKFNAINTIQITSETENFWYNFIGRNIQHFIFEYDCVVKFVSSETEEFVWAYMFKNPSEYISRYYRFYCFEPKLCVKYSEKGVPTMKETNSVRDICINKGKFRNKVAKIV